MYSAVKEAKQTLENADSLANEMASVLTGRLRKVNWRHLDKLKKELTKYNSKTGEWKD